MTNIVPLSTLDVTADRGEAGNMVAATVARADGRGVAVRFEVSAAYPSLVQLLFDGEPVCGVWPWLGRADSDQRPGVTCALESADKDAQKYVTLVEFDRRVCKLFDVPGDHVLTVKGWRGVPGNDFSVLAVDRDFRLAVPPRPAPELPSVGGKIPSALFRLTPDAIISGALTERVARQVADTLETDVFFNPADGGPENPLDTFDRWKADWETRYVPRFAWLRGHGFKAFGIGDSWYRSPAERAWILSTPWAWDAVAHVSHWCSAYRDVFVGVEAFDEFENEGTGFKTDTTVPDRFIDAWRSVPDPVPVSWPGWLIGNGRTDDPRRCDYVSRYPYAEGSWAQLGFGPNGGWTLPQVRRQFEGMTDGVNPDLPLCLMTTVLPEWPVESILMQYAVGLAGGGRAFRGYHYADPTSGGRGVKPGTPHWDALTRAVRWLRKYESRLGGHRCPPAYDGPWCEARVGDLRYLVNTSDSPQYCPYKGRLTSPGEFDVLRRGGTVPPGCVLVLS